MFFHSCVLGVLGVLGVRFVSFGFHAHTLLACMLRVLALTRFGSLGFHAHTVAAHMRMLRFDCCSMHVQFVHAVGVYIDVSYLWAFGSS